MPGWSKGTVGYHVDDGKIFHAENPDKGKEVEGNISLAFLATYLASESTRGIRTLIMFKFRWLEQHNKNAMKMVLSLMPTDNSPGTTSAGPKNNINTCNVYTN